MAKKTFLHSIELQIQAAIDVLTSGFIGLAAKSDGLYVKDRTSEGKIWTSANHGNGSGLDADMLDGKHASQFASSDSVVITFNGRNGDVKLEKKDIEEELTGEITTHTHPSSGGGGVTSVGLSMPDEFQVSNSPITSSGNLSVTKKLQGTNAFYAGPYAAQTGYPEFRTIGKNDLPFGLCSITKTELSNSPAPISANTWTPVTGVAVAITEYGNYLVNCQINLARSSTNGYVAARLKHGSTVIASSESYGNYRASFFLSTILTYVASGTITLEIWSSIAGTSPVSSTVSSGSASATILNVIRLF